VIAAIRTYLVRGIGRSFKSPPVTWKRFRVDLIVAGLVVLSGIVLIQILQG
jgi:hypothetical protein